jgi:hypothetical protein
MLSTSSARQLVREQMMRLRAECDLPPDPDTAMLFRYLHLAFEPPRFHDPALPLPATAHLLRPAAISESGSERQPSWLCHLPALPTVYATLGTAFNTRTPGLFEAILAGLRDEPVQPRPHLTSGYGCESAARSGIPRWRAQRR